MLNRDIQVKQPQTPRQRHLSPSVFSYFTLQFYCDITTFTTSTTFEKNVSFTSINQNIPAEKTMQSGR